MPKAFSEHEKETIRAQLREKARKLFEKQGLKKTTVDELAQAAGISKGAFYLFYESKEELFLEILEALEADFRARGVTIVNPFKLHRDGSASFYCADPDGVVIQILYEPTLSCQRIS